MHEALANSVPARSDADIEIGWSPNRVEVRAEPIAAEEIAAAEPERRPAPLDHSMYQRPQRAGRANLGA
jgi:hypothetical protein